MADAMPTVDLAEARSRAESLLSAHMYVQARDVLMPAISQSWPVEQEFLPAVATLATVLTRLGDARGALSCLWYAGDFQNAQGLLAAVPAPDRGRTLAAQARAKVSDPARASELWARAAAEFESAKLVAHAAVYREKAGDYSTASALWSRLCKHIGQANEGDLYAAGLAQFNLARASRKLNGLQAAHNATVAAVHLLEEAADRYETIGQRERAFDCFHVLVAIGRECSVVEHVLEGYINVIRILREDQLRLHALQHYDDAIQYLHLANEKSAAATLAGEMASYARKQAMPGVASHALMKQAEMWREVASATMQRGGPAEIAENALLAAVLCYAELGQFTRVGDAYVELANLPIEQARRTHYGRASSRYTSARNEQVDTSVGVDRLDHEASFPEVWHVDLMEWEQRGSASDACADVILDPKAWSEIVRRRALVARLIALPIESASQRVDDQSWVALVEALSSLELYNILSPLESLLRRPETQVRIATARALGRFLYKRTFIALRSAMLDSDAQVRSEACRAIEQLRFPHAFDPLARIFRESSDPQARTAALRALAHIDTDEAIETVLGVLRHAGPTERDAVAAALSTARSDRFSRALTTMMSSVPEPVAANLRQSLQAHGVRV